jgi:hypothetical protein
MMKTKNCTFNQKELKFTRLIIAGLTLLIVALFLGAPTGGNFYWSDAPRHALNGVFVKDFVAAAPWDDPSGFAYRYYAQYPALTILFYPPLFYAISAPFYALMGVSHSTAIFVVMLHYIVFALGAWRLFSFWFSGWRAVAATVMLVTAPEIAFWGRQIMLEVPAFAFLIWSTVCFTLYRREAQPRMLYWAVALLVLAMYTKISVAFMAPVFAGTLLAERRTTLFKDKHIWISGLLAVIALIPLLVLTMKFGQANVQSVTGIADATVGRDSLNGWVWYLRQMPEQIGWPVCIVAIFGLGALFLGQSKKRTTHWNVANQGDFFFWVTWALFGYLFFSAIDLKEARHSVFILPPVVMLACVMLLRLSAWGWPRIAVIVWIGLPLAVLIQTVVFRPVYFVSGYASAVDFVARMAPRDSRVLFSGYQDGSFIFNMRCREDRRDLGLVRADKLLLNIAVRRELGVIEKNISEAELGDQINRLGIHYVVSQPDFWTDLEAMKRLERLLATSQFKEVARFETPANYKAHEKYLVIYQNLGAVSDGKSGMRIDLPIIGKSIDTTK